MMTHRERVLRTFRFEDTDRVPCDLMEGTVWEPVSRFFRDHHGVEDPLLIQDRLDTDLRWNTVRYGPPPEARLEPDAEPAPPAAEEPPIYSQAFAHGPLGDATTVAEVENCGRWGDSGMWQPGDYAGGLRQWPEHARVLGHTWIYPLFWGTCEAFGMETALVHFHSDSPLVEAYVRKQQEHYMAIMRRALAAGRGKCDICWLGDDYASQQNLMIRPETWRKHIKPYVAEQVELVHAHDMRVLFHSCGAIRDIIPDMIDIGIDALLVFQTTARGMDPESIARDFGGRMVFYGGIDVQQTLSSGTVPEVKEAVRRNLRAFADCGGYVVANSHHCVDTVKGENIEAMCEAAHEGL